jgi:outer membrane protein assembly factor BamB
VKASGRAAIAASRGLASTAVAAALLATTASGCGGGQTRLNLFSTDWQDDGGVSIGRVYQRVAAVPVSPAADVVVGIAGHANKIIGLPLGGGSKWTFAHALSTRPVVTGGVVVGSGSGEVFALEAATGRVIWRRPTGDVPLLGAGDDGTVTVVAFRQAVGSGCTLLAVTHDGQIVRQIETDKPLGAPAVLGRLAFVPWAGQYVSVIDLTNGDETARVTLRDETSRAWTEGGSLWFGQVGYTRFDARIQDASKGKASRAGIKLPTLPGTPRLMPSGGAPVAAIAGAEDKVRLYARPEAGGDAGAAIDGGRFYGTYFRLAMGYDSASAKLAWVHVHDASFVGGAASAGGVLLCDEQGRVSALDAQTGGVAFEADLGEPLQACVVNVDSWHPSQNPAQTKSLAGQLGDALLADDPQLVPEQKVFLHDIASATDDVATKALVDLASDPRTSPDLVADTRKALASRTNGARYMEAALGRHYDYMKDVLRPPPVGPMAHALAAMKETAAAPLLASHLLDPADTDDDVMQTAAALVVVGTPAELPALRQFFAMYRATAASDEVAAAIVSAGQAIATLDPASRAALQAAAEDPTTVAYAQDRLVDAIKASAPAEPAKGNKDKGEKAPAKTK